MKIPRTASVWYTEIKQLKQITFFTQNSTAVMLHMCVQCMVIACFRVTAVYLDQFLSKNLFFLARNWLCKTKRFSAQSALKLTYRHLGFQKFSQGLHPEKPDPFRRERERKGGEGREGKTPSATPRTEYWLRVCLLIIIHMHSCRQRKRNVHKYKYNIRFVGRRSTKRSGVQHKRISTIENYTLEPF